MAIFAADREANLAPGQSEQRAVENRLGVAQLGLADTELSIVEHLAERGGV